VKATIGVSVLVDVLEVGSLERSTGKLLRLIDQPPPGR
jgi:phenylacetate-coenzyme A ligase PaaK-like adenylate-forming protein